MEENNNSDLTLYILLSVSGLLIVIDGLELIHMIYNWEYGFLIVKPVFESCIKYELISKTVFSIYSFIAAFSAFFLAFFLLCGQEFFLNKLRTTYLYINYIVFGPLMAALSILGICHWEQVVYVCDKNNLYSKEVSVSNSITIIGCFLISVVITVIVEFFESINFLLDSILKRNTGSHIIGRFFWQIATYRANQARMQPYNRNNNDVNNHDSNLYLNNDTNVNREANLANQNNEILFNNNPNNRDLNINNLENEKLIPVNTQDTSYNIEEIHYIASRDCNLYLNSCYNNEREDNINEAKNKLEKRNNITDEACKNT